MNYNCINSEKESALCYYSSGFMQKKKLEIGDYVNVMSMFAHLKNSGTRKCCLNN